MMDFGGVETARQRLQDCIIRYDGKPVYVESVGYDRQERIQAKLFFLDQKTPRKSVLLTDDLLDDEPVSLGLIEDNRHMYILSRGPIRTYKVGLSTSNASVTYYHKGAGTPQPIRPTSSILIGYGTYRAIVNKYQAYEEAMGQFGFNPNIDGDAYGKPFSRDFGIVPGKKNEPLLFHRFAGVVGECGKTPTLQDEFFYLRETLEEALNEHA